MNRRLIARVVVALFAVALLAIPAQAMAGKHHGHHGKKPKPLVVCKHGCKYRTIQKAVDASGKKDTIQVKPGTYSEGVLVKGSKHDGLTIEGTSSNAKRVKLNGKNAHGPSGVANSGIEATDVDGITLKNMWAKNYAANGFFFSDSNPGDDKPNKSIKCRDYLAKNLVASFNRAYGIYAFGCIGGRITKSTGYGQGDSAFYIGGTPVQSTNPDWTSLDHLDGHENVLGYSGTNSRYVDINNSNFYNNGVGVVPNTLGSEPYIPTADGKIRDNNIFWNNFNYFLPNSKVATVSDGLGDIGGKTVQYPTGVGIVLLGADGWVVKDNNIFGNFKYGAATVSNPLVGDAAQVKNNQFIDNKMGKGGTDTNAVDFFADGSGTANCWEGNNSSTFDPSSTITNEDLYPDCEHAAGTGTGSDIGNGEQFNEIVNYATTDPPENQECSWTKHSHPAFKSYKALSITPGPDCP